MSRWCVVVFVEALLTAGCFGLEWNAEVEDAFLVDEMSRYDEYEDLGIQVVDSFAGKKFLIVRGTITTKGDDPNAKPIKIDAKSVSVKWGEDRVFLSAHQWNPKNLSLGLSYFSLRSQDEVLPFYWIFIVPAEKKPESLVIHEKEYSLTIGKGKPIHPAETAEISIKSTHQVDSLSGEIGSYPITQSGGVKRERANRKMTAISGRLLGVTLSVSPKMGGFKDPDLWHHTFRSMGIVVNGRWSPAITQAKPDGSGFLANGGGILVNRQNGEWQDTPAREGTFFFNVPDDCGEFKITLCGGIVAEGNLKE